MGQRADVGELLRQGEWFAGLPPRLQELILRHSIVRNHARGQVIQVEDTPAPGLWFGEIAVHFDRTLVTAVAQAATRTLVLPNPEYDRIIDDEPRYFAAFAQITFERYRIMLRYFAESVRLDPSHRLRLRLASLADTRRAETATPDRDVVLDLTQEELAKIVGQSRQRLNGRLKALAEEGWIELGHRHIRVLDPNGLRASALGDGAGNAPELATAAAPESDARPRAPARRSPRLRTSRA